MFVLIPILAVIMLNSTSCIMDVIGDICGFSYFNPGIIIITLLGVDLLIKNIKNKYFLNFFDSFAC